MFSLFASVIENLNRAEFGVSHEKDSDLSEIGKSAQEEYLQQQTNRWINESPHANASNQTIPTYVAQYLVRKIIDLPIGKKPSSSKGKTNLANTFLSVSKKRSAQN